jgi:hypothetical protein
VRRLVAAKNVVVLEPPVPQDAPAAATLPATAQLVGVGGAARLDEVAFPGHVRIRHDVGQKFESLSTLCPPVTVWARPNIEMCLR